MKVVIVFGTRPEIIKLASLAKSLEGRSEVRVQLWNTGQHQHLVEPLLRAFGLKADRTLGLTSQGQGLGGFFARSLGALSAAIEEERPDLMIVQGDTSTAAAGGVAAFYQRVPVAHVEAGLRTYDFMAPWPEEYNRRLISIGAHWHFAPTEMARENLLREGVRENRVVVTGNTGIDALLWMVNKQRGSAGVEFALKWRALDFTRPMILCTLHRRESFGVAMQGLMGALRDLAANGEAQLVLPLHPNPEVRNAAALALGEVPPKNLHIVDPLDYGEFLWLMDHCHFLISDSGGVQEEAPALGKPVIVTRDRTERPEAVEAGANILAGTNPAEILHTAQLLLKSQTVYQRMAKPRYVYGDGQASQRICEVILPGTVKNSA